MILENELDIPASGDIWVKNIFPFQNSFNGSQEYARKASALAPNPLLTLAQVSFYHESVRGWGRGVGLMGSAFSDSRRKFKAQNREAPVAAGPGTEGKSGRPGGVRKREAGQRRRGRDRRGQATPTCKRSCSQLSGGGAARGASLSPHRSGRSQRSASSPRAERLGVQGARLRVTLRVRAARRSPREEAPNYSPQGPRAWWARGAGPRGGAERSGAGRRRCTGGVWVSAVRAGVDGRDAGVGEPRPPEEQGKAEGGKRSQGKCEGDTLRAGAGVETGGDGGTQPPGFLRRRAAGLGGSLSQKDQNQPPSGEL